MLVAAEQPTMHFEYTVYTVLKTFYFAAFINDHVD